MDPTPLQGRWYARAEDAQADVELYLDVNEELLFRAIHYRRGGGRYKSQQVVLTIERLEASDGGWEIDLSVARCIEDGRDLTGSHEGKLVRGRGRREPRHLLLCLPEPGEPRPGDLSSAYRFEKRSGA